MTRTTTRRSAALRLAAPAVLVALVVAACSGTAASPSAAPASAAAPSADAGGATIEGSWQLAEYAGPNGNTIPVPDAIAATAQFEGGKVSGNGGCNQYNGTYTLDGATIAISQLASTQMACGKAETAVETAFLALLPTMTGWSVTGDSLSLTTAEGKVGMSFKAAEAPGLTGTQWSATGINNGKQALVSVATGTQVTALFGEDGQVVGNGGCNQYNAPYTVDGSSIKIGPVASTKMLCEGDAGTQEAAYFAALEAATTFDFENGSLVLRDAGGAMQVTYEAAAS